MYKLKAALSEVKVGNACHTIMKTWLQLPEDGDCPVGNEKNTIFNLIMIDVSASMEGYWDTILTSWNEHISPQLKGNTKIYVFGTDVHFIRNGTHLEKSDFLSQMTNLTEAIATINSQIGTCQEEQIKVFIITDGAHNATETTPNVEINKLFVPDKKTIEVFLLGVGNSFPVEYSITIRSALHNGNSNIPSLFWAKSERGGSEGILAEMLNIADILKSTNIKLKLSHPAYLAPGFPETTTVHSSEFTYFTCSPSELMSLKVSVEDGPIEDFEVSVEKISIGDLLNTVFRQWNSLIIQRHHQKLEIPSISFEIMEEIYKSGRESLLAVLETAEHKSIKYRISMKKVKSIDIEFATLMNQSRTIIGLESKYSSEIELAEKILKTTVRGKYFHKNLKMKGHSADDYENDKKRFSEIYEKLKNDIMALPDSSPDDCCRVTMCSMLQDLKDPSFLELLAEDKFTFMKTFTVTGFPVYCPVKDSSQINPWALNIKNILASPFTIISQNTLEISADIGNVEEDSINKEIYLQEGDENTRFNVIIPVFTPELASILKPLIRTNIFSMLTTFCILKDPHIIEYNAHIAGLGCTWIKLLRDFPSAADRPEFAVGKLSLIQATAEIYLDRKDIDKYLKVLLSEPNEALMTESNKEYDGKTVKCETLIKPMFILYLTRAHTSTIEKMLTIPVLQLLVQEFIGRCMGNVTKSDSAPEYIYSYFFCPALASTESRKNWLDKEVKEHSIRILENFESTHEGRLVENFFTLSDLKKSLEAFCHEQFKKIGTTLLAIALNEKVVNGLKSESSAGNIKLSSLKTFAQEMSLSGEVNKSLFEREKLLVYVVQSLKYSSSRDRLKNPLPTYTEALKLVKRKLKKENNRMFQVGAIKQILDDAEAKWRKDFNDLHHTTGLVTPMIRKEIMFTALQRGVQVTEETFDKVFRHNPRTGLLRNACMVKSCSFYLMPNRSFNQHLSETRGKGYAHQLHRISHQQAAVGGTADGAIQTILRGYQSMNGLKIPETPPSDQLSERKDSISGLINRYAFLKL